MSKNNMCINGKYFTTHNEPVLADEKYISIYDVYARPSQTKVSIWFNWLKWFQSNNGHCWVHSYNTNIFTIRGYIYIGKTKYTCMIYPTHNEIYPCK